MIEEIGTVTRVNGPLAVVSVPAKSACEGCTAGTCQPAEKTMEIEAYNQAGAVEGQKVRVSVKSSAYMTGSLVVYGIPALALIAGAVFGKEVLSRFMPGSDPDSLSAAAGFAFLFVSFLLVRLWGNATGKKTSTKPVIEEILH